MGRAEIRRAEREKKKSETAVYHLTKAQLDASIEKGVRDILAKNRAKLTEDAINKAMALTFVLPMKVLMRDYGFTKELPDFADKLVDMYDDYLNKGLDLHKLKEEVWELGGVRIEVGDD